MRLMPNGIRFWTAMFLLIYWSALNVAPAGAGLAPSRVSGTTTIAAPRDADLLVMRRVLEHRVVAQKLQDYGVTAADVESRMATMSDDELHTLATASAGLPTGSDSLGTILTLLLIVLVVILIMKLLDKKVVIK